VIIFVQGLHCRWLRFGRLWLLFSSLCPFPPCLLFPSSGLRAHLLECIIPRTKVGRRGCLHRPTDFVGQQREGARGLVRGNMYARIEREHGDTPCTGCFSFCTRECGGARGRQSERESGIVARGSRSGVEARQRPAAQHQRIERGGGRIRGERRAAGW